jgi:16S rRNA pseudouridine516 synthase
MRLDKLLSQSANISRSEARKAIWQGRVAVDGKVIFLVDAIAMPGCELVYDGVMVSSQITQHLMFNKPAGVLTAARDNKAPTVMDLLPDNLIRIKCMPIGRLDKDTEGLLIFTTNGELAHRLLSPKRQIEKEYLARVTGKLATSAESAFRQGIRLKNFTALPASLMILEGEDDYSMARVIITEGKHRQIRRMFQHLGHEVVSLKRLRIGSVFLDRQLKEGQYRPLTNQELFALQKEVGLV